MDYGHMLERSKVETGLQELNKDFHFDMGTKLGMIHPLQSIRQGVFWKGMHICSMDRGMVNGHGLMESMIPEFKVWSQLTTRMPATIAEADCEDASVRYHVIPDDTPGYEDMYLDAQRNRGPYSIRPDGKLQEMLVFRDIKTRGRCIYVGWRHTFERIILAKIHGAGRIEIAEKFGVNMFLEPGDPRELADQIVDEGW